MMLFDAYKVCFLFDFRVYLQFKNSMGIPGYCIPTFIPRPPKDCFMEVFEVHKTYQVHHHALATPASPSGAPSPGTSQLNIQATVSDGFSLGMLRLLSVR